MLLKVDTIIYNYPPPFVSGKDTLFPSSALKDEFISPSFFQNHLLEKINDDSIIHYTKYDYLSALILFIVLSIFVWLFISNHKFISYLIKSIYMPRFFTIITKDESAKINRGMIFLSFLFLLLLTLFLGEIIIKKALVDNISYGILLLQIALAIIVIYLVKIITIKFLGFVFKLYKESNEYTSGLMLFWNTSALLLFPVVTGMLFIKNVSIDIFMYCGIFGILVFFISRMASLVLLGINNPHISKLYLFLYLCTLEILPILILYKLFKIYQG